MSANKVSDIIFPPADVSIISLPKKTEEARSVANNLFNTPVLNHICMVLIRGGKKNKIETLKNLSIFQECGWKFLDDLTIFYKKLTSSPKNSFSPISEHAFIFYKGLLPNTENESNLWSCQDPDSCYQKFNGDILIDLFNMKSSLEHNSAILLNKVSDDELENIKRFADEYRLNVHVCIDNDNLNKLSKEKNHG